MKHNQLVSAIVAAAALVAGASVAEAQDPTFAYSEDKALEEIAKTKEVEWKASAQAGLILTTGNARTTTMAAGARASRKANKNKFQLEVGGAFSRSSLFLANDDNADGDIDPGEFQRLDQTVARLLEGKARYDRYLSTLDALYISAAGLTNEPAGKSFVGGGQAGYSRTAFESDRHTLQVEVGYDFSYEEPITGDGFSSHSMRGFAAYQSKLTADAGFDASVEALVNGNEYDTPTGRADRFQDTRVNTRLALTTKLYKDMSFRFGFEARYDNVPSPLPPFSSPYQAGFVPEAQKLDTKTEATLIVNFL